MICPQADLSRRAYGLKEAKLTQVYRNVFQINRPEAVRRLTDYKQNSGTMFDANESQKSNFEICIIFKTEMNGSYILTFVGISLAFYHFSALQRRFLTRLKAFYRLESTKLLQIKSLVQQLTTSTLPLTNFIQFIVMKST